jgi:prevent-host-death family protein
MRVVNMLEAKSNLSRLVDAVERGHETEIIIARNGRPAARLVSVAAGSAARRIGIARGLFIVPETIDADEGAIATLFSQSDP